MNYPILSYINHYRQFHGLIYEDLASGLGLSQLEIDIILFLYNSPEYNTARDIVNYRGFAKSNVSTAVDSLKRKGYLTTYADPDSKKLQRLGLTPGKKESIALLRQCQKQEFAVMLDGFTEEDYQKLKLLMAQMDANIVSAVHEKKTSTGQVRNGGIPNVI